MSIHVCIAPIYTHRRHDKYAHKTWLSQSMRIVIYSTYWTLIQWMELTPCLVRQNSFLRLIIADEHFWRVALYQSQCRVIWALLSAWIYSDLISFTKWQQWQTIPRSQLIFISLWLVNFDSSLLIVYQPYHSSGPEREETYIESWLWSAAMSQQCLFETLTCPSAAL